MPLKNYRDDLLKRLSDPKYSSQYLKAALEETLQDGNKEAFLFALKNIIEAKQLIQTIPKNQEISKQNIDKLIFRGEELTLEQLVSILHSVGLSIDFQPIVD